MIEWHFDASPPRSGYYLVAVKHGDTRSTTAASYTVAGGGYWYHTYPLTGVYAWAEMPQAPAEPQP